VPALGAPSAESDALMGTTGIRATSSRPSGRFAGAHEGFASPVVPQMAVAQTSGPSVPALQSMGFDAGLSTAQGPYGDRMAALFGLTTAPSLTTTALHSAQMAATRLTSEDRGTGMTSPIPVENAYIVTLHLRVLRGIQLWKTGRLVAEGPFAEGSIGIVHLEEEPIAVLSEAFDCLQFYIPEIIFDEMSDDRGAPRVTEFEFQSATPDPVMHQLGQALLPALENPCRESRLFFDHVAFAAYSHLAVRYGGQTSHATRLGGRLSVSQERLAKEMLGADLSGEPSISDAARVCGLPVTRFVREFRQTTGESPHRWVRRLRIDRAKELLFNSSLSLAQIAYDCGFADQSHFTRVFAEAAGMTPGAWRRARHVSNRTACILPDRQVPALPEPSGSASFAGWEVSMSNSNRVERGLETVLFASRWLMAPLYLGLVIALAALLATFARELFQHLPGLLRSSEADVILWLLALIDLSLVGNLLITVMLAGYTNFVSHMEEQNHPDWPAWMGFVDFSGMKQKLIASIVAISSIHLLEIFMTPEKLDTTNIGWLLAIQGTVLVSGVLLAATDYISEHGRRADRTHEFVSRNADRIAKA
jgi:AraC family transcriptional regulator